MKNDAFLRKRRFIENDISKRNALITKSFTIRLSVAYIFTKFMSQRVYLWFELSLEWSSISDESSQIPTDHNF